MGLGGVEDTPRDGSNGEPNLDHPNHHLNQPAIVLLPDPVQTVQVANRMSRRKLNPVAMFSARIFRSRKEVSGRKDECRWGLLASLKCAGRQAGSQECKDSAERT